MGGRFMRRYPVRTAANPSERSRRKKREQPKFLSGWKEIANYLGKGVRTVQRYERHMGFPVRRPAGKTRAAVVATKAELDAWVAASPIREAFHLTRPDGTFARVPIVGMDEMRRLRAELTDLRTALRTSVHSLKESIESLQCEMKDSRPSRTQIDLPSTTEARMPDLFGLTSYTGGRKAS
jgi:hypothetical protein